MKRLLTILAIFTCLTVKAQVVTYNQVMAVTTQSSLSGIFGSNGQFAYCIDTQNIFVWNGGAWGPVPQPSVYLPNFLSKSANYTIVGGDFAAQHPPILQIWCDATGGAFTLTLPNATTFSGYQVIVGKVDGVNPITISGCSYDNIMTVAKSCKTFMAASGNWVQN